MSENALPSEVRILRYTSELVAYVDGLFPMRFYSGERWWRAHLAAALLRLSEIADSILRCLPDRRDLDAAAALRSMYELAVTVAWILIDPRERNFLWGGEALLQQLKLHNDLATFGEELLSSDEVAHASVARGMPSLANRAAAADRHWHSEVPGLHHPRHLLSFRGLYNAIYRQGSRPVHGSIASLFPYIHETDRRVVVAPARHTDEALMYAFVSPLLSMPLIIASTRVMWIDETKIRSLNDQATASGPPLKQSPSRLR